MLFILILISSFFINAMKLDRVILATNANEKYIQFWPIVAQAWQEIVGIRPTLILVAPKSVHVDEKYGDVIYFEPLPGLPTSYQAQVIRLFAPVLFPDDICILADIDMLPLQKNFFTAPLENQNDDMFVVYSKYPDQNRYPMCYVAGKGKTYQELFDITWSGVQERLYEWYKAGYGWSTDELKMAIALHTWSASEKRVFFLNDIRSNQISRNFWHYDENILQNREYVDAHLLRPYVDHKKEIDIMLECLGLRSTTDFLTVIQYSKDLISKKISAQEQLCAELNIIDSFSTKNDVIALIKKNNAMSQQKSEVLNCRHYLSITDFAASLPYAFIHLLMLDLKGSQAEEIKSMQHLFKYHQIGCLYIDFDASTLNAKIAARVFYQLLADCGYVLFKVTPNGLMHVPKRSDLKTYYYQSSYIAFAPQYARGWASIQDK